MASSRPFVNTTRIPSPTRPRRSSATSSTKFLHPNRTGHPKVRPISLPESSSQTFPTSPSSTRLSSPSKLPRPSIQPPRRRHRPSASISVDVSPSKPNPKRVGAKILPQQQPLHIDVPALLLPPNPNPQPTLPRQFSKRNPQYILNELYIIVDAAKIREYLPLDVMLAVHEREIMEGAARLQRARSIRGYSEGRETMVSSSAGTMGVFGFPLRHIALYASTKAVLGGFEHDLPIVVFACVEELYRSGISTPSNPTPTSPSPNNLTRRTLSSSPLPPNPTHPRLSALVPIFDSPINQFGLHASLKDELSDDIYALLTTFLERLPEPVIAPLEILKGLRDALWMWCVKPKHHSGSNSTSTGETRIRIAQMLLGLLPTPNLSLFVYLMAFSCQVLEVRMRRRRRESEARDSLSCGSALEVQLLKLERELEEKNEREREKRRLGRAWGGWLFGRDDNDDVRSERRESGVRDYGGPGEEDNRSTQMMVWFVSNWGGIIRGFFEGGISVDPDPVVEHPSRSAMRGVLEIESPRVHVQQPLTESLFTTSASLDRLRGDGGSPNVTPRQAPFCASPLRIGIVRGQSYGKATDLLIPPEIAQEGSIHSRYSALGIDGEIGSGMMKEGSKSSGSSALGGRLLDLDVPLVQSSASLNRLRGDGVSPNATPKQVPLDPNSYDSMKTGPVRGQKTTEMAHQEGSTRSRYSAVGNGSKMMVKEGSQGTVSSAYERLLGLDLDIPQDVPLVKASLRPTPPDSDAASCRFQIRDETTDDLRSESISTSVITSASAYACTPEPPIDCARTPKPPPDITRVPSQESKLAVLEYQQPGPLRVVNRSDDEDLSSGSDSESESVYSVHGGEDGDGDGDGVPKLVFGSDSSESESASEVGLDVGTGMGLSVRDGVYPDMFSRNHYEGLPNPHPHEIFGMSTPRTPKDKCCTQCVGDCPVHVYVKELEMRVGELVEENRRLRVRVREV